MDYPRSYGTVTGERWWTLTVSVSWVPVLQRYSHGALRIIRPLTTTVDKMLNVSHTMIHWFSTYQDKKREDVISDHHYSFVIIKKKSTVIYQSMAHPKSERNIGKWEDFRKAQMAFNKRTSANQIKYRDGTNDEWWYNLIYLKQFFFSPEKWQPY